MRALLVVCLLAHGASADELPTIDSEFPPTLRIQSDSWNVRLERVAVAVRSAPETTFVSISVAGRKQATLSIDVPSGTRVTGLGVADIVWGRPMFAELARDHIRFRDGAMLSYESTSADADHLNLVVTAPSTIELALHLPPLARLAVEANAGVLVVEVDGERRPSGKHRALLDLADVVGTTFLRTPHVDEDVSLVATPSTAADFLPHTLGSGPHVLRDLDKAMIRRRMKWFRPHLRRCFMAHAQRDPSLTHGGVVVSFMIAPIGTVEWAKATESDLPDAVNACLVAQVLTWEFPAADSNVQVNYPLEFRLVE